MFHYLYYSVTISEFKEKFRIVFCCFSAIKNIVTPSSPNFPANERTNNLSMFLNAGSIR